MNRTKIYGCNMHSPIAMMSILLFFGIVSLAFLTETSSQSSEPGFMCGNEFFQEEILRKRVEQVGVSLRQYHGHLEYDSEVYKLPITNSKSPELPHFIIVDVKHQIVGVISPNMVDETVDNNKNSCHEIINVDYPETFINYRKCEERPLLNSVTSLEGGFQCGNGILKTQDALKAAYFARKMYRKNTKFSLSSFSLSSLMPQKFNGMKSRYRLPITANGDYDLKGHISIALDKKFNVIGASLHKLQGDAKCHELTHVPPKIVGHIMGIMQNIAGYKCPSGYLKASRILTQAMAVSFVFKDRSKISAQNFFFPRLYTGAYFPGVSEPLYYFPLASGAEKLIPVYIILKRSLDVVGVLEMSRLGFVLCTEETQQHSPESISEDHSNRYTKPLLRLH